MGVSPSTFISVYSQNKNNNYLKAIKLGFWISPDGFGGEIENYIDKIIFATTHAFLYAILISRGAGCFDAQ
jgi:hypothetical protein